jgi:hypothetical protein
MPRVIRAASARPEEEGLLGRSRQAAILTAGIVVVTAVVFALVADHGVLTRIQRLDDAWLRLMISGRTPLLTAIAKVFNGRPRSIPGGFCRQLVTVIRAMSSA